MTHAPADLLRVARSYQACSEFRVGDGYVEMHVSIPGFRVMKVMLRLSKDRSIIWMSVEARYFSCLKEGQFQSEREETILTTGSVDWSDPTPRLELQVETATPGFSRAIDEALDALRNHWAVPIGVRRE